MNDSMPPCIKMVQKSICNWYIETETGTILVEDIMLGLEAEAEEYVKRYVSSFQTWNYKLVPLNGGKNNGTV